MGGIGGGVALAVLGVALIVFLGRNYTVCQNVLVQATSQSACQGASLFHWAGIVLMILGGAAVLGGVIAGGRG